MRGHPPALYVSWKYLCTYTRLAIWRIFRRDISTSICLCRRRRSSCPLSLPDSLHGLWFVLSSVGFIPPRARARSLMQYGSSSSSSSSSSGAPGAVGGGILLGSNCGSLMSAASPACSLLSQSVPCLETKARILHPGDLIRAKHMPYNSFSIVTLNEEGLAMYWNFSRHSSFPS